MRILIAACVPRQREGGVATIIYSLGEEFQRFGHSVTYAFREDIFAGKKEQTRLEGLVFAVRIARKILRSPEKYDVVNLHAPIGWVYGLLRKVLRRKRWPRYVMMMHGLEERYVYEMKREASRGRAWHFGLRNRIWHRLYHMPSYRFCIQTAEGAVVSNREAKNTLEVKYKRDSRRVWFVPNGAAESMFLTRNYSARGPLRLLFVGSWLDRKGIYYLVDALAPLAEKIPEIQLTVAGCAAQPEEVRGYFDEAVRSRVEVVPFIESGEMPEVYRAHDIFVFPSLVEGMPLALLEAMASGMPVVTTDSCGMADMVEDGVNGLLVLPANADALVAAVSRLCRSPELRRSLGQTAQLTMRRFTWEKVARRFEDIFMTVAGIPRSTEVSAAFEAKA
jgi:glycosyltransferase involved in cell wall biosynthesis